MTTLKLTGSNVGLSVFQFVGLLRVVEFNADSAAKANEAMRAMHGINTVLTAFAALEALVMETAYVIQPELYEEKSFRLDGLAPRFVRYRNGIDRPVAAHELPAVIVQVSDLRKALTHSEPDNKRSASVGATLMDGTALLRIAADIRKSAEWLWDGGRPHGVGTDFDAPNALLARD